MNIQRYRAKQLSGLTNNVGVYALCDLDEVPIYIGQSTDGIRKRVQRHLTSARSDVIANRLIDVWEVAFVWAWPMPGATRKQIGDLERHLANRYHKLKPLMNGKILPPPANTPENIPQVERVEILPVEEIDKRKDPLLRLPRQMEHFTNLFSHILEVKDKEDLRRALRAHFERLSAYYYGFMDEPESSPVEEPEEDE